MTIKVVVRKIAKGYSATFPGFSDCSAEASTREAAIEQVKLEAKDLLTKVSELDFEVMEEPEQKKRKELSDFFGMWKDDESWDEFTAAMKEYREQVDSQSR